MQIFEHSFSRPKDKGIGDVDTGIVLGTGLDDLLLHLDVQVPIPYADIPGFVIYNFFRPRNVPRSGTSNTFRMANVAREFPKF
jgi:purine nucleoside phosphorylase